MPSQIVIENGRRVLKVPGGADFDLGAASDPPLNPRLAAANDPMAKIGRGLVQDPLSRKLTRAVASPEGMATVSSLLAPESLLIPPLVAAGTSVARDIGLGNRDPESIAGGALMHGAVNAIPPVAGKAVKFFRSASPAAAEVASSTMLGGPKGGALAYIKNLLTGGTEATAPSARAAATAGGGLADMTLPSGQRVMSSQGLKELVQHSIDLENSGAPKAQVAAVDQLIEQVRRGIQPGAQTPSNLLAQTGMQTGSASGSARAAQAATRAAQTESIATKVRKALGLTLTGANAAHDLLSSEP